MDITRDIRFHPNLRLSSCRRDSSYIVSLLALYVILGAWDAVAKLVESSPTTQALAKQLKLVSVEKLLRMLAAIDQDVEITVKPRRKRGVASRTTIVPAA